MDLLYATDVPRSAVNHIIRASEDAIRMRQICKNQLHAKCSKQISSILAQNFHNALQQFQQQPQLDSKNPKISSIDSDNRTPMKLKINKNPNEIIKDRLSFDSKSFRKSSAIKSRRDQCTASTNRKLNDVFNRTHNGSFAEQQRPWTQTECRKKFCPTANSSPRHKYFQLKEQKGSISVEQEVRRKQLKERRTKQKLNQEKIQHALMKLSYQRRALQEEFEAAKVGQKRFSISKNRPINQIVNYETQNGTVLTNRFKKPFRKTIENIINLEFEQRTRERILKRKSQRQYDVQGSNKKKGDDQEIERENFALKNNNYNNSGRRQTSLIPYVTINPGVSLSQSIIQASISRGRPADQLSRQKFFSSIQNKTFRSFSKETSPEKLEKQMMTIDLCEKHRASKSTFNNETKDSLRKSILWGSKTSRKEHRIKLEKDDFLKEFTD